jgi:hypothetical protein
MSIVLTGVARPHGRLRADFLLAGRISGVAVAKGVDLEDGARPGVVRKEDLAKQIAERDHIEQGLICILSVLEPCRTFSFRSDKSKPFVASARRKCLFLYFYFIHRDFGLMHVRLQTCFPLQIQVCGNGHAWLARKLKKNGIRYCKRENAVL